MKKFEKLTVCLDMRGCPNRCRHCWLGDSPNGNMGGGELVFAADTLRGFAERFEIDFWYREPDFCDNYAEMWELTEKLSDEKTPHFELMSFWRAARDKDYVPWLFSKGVRACQLTLFGGEEKTDFYVGRKGAYREILKAAELLLDNKIAPRFQVFVNKDNIGELSEVERLVEDMELEKRCESFGAEFNLFVHQGSCDGENEKLYGVRVTEGDLEKIPKKISEMTLKYFGKKDLKEIFGEKEGDLCRRLIKDRSTLDLRESSPVFYVDGSFDVYPNISAPSPIYKLGNLKKGGEGIVGSYSENKSLAQKTSAEVPVCEMAEKCGDFNGERLFSAGDYRVYLLNKYCVIAG